MKILHLKFKNLNSLAGEQIINFDQPPISSSGLFTIVGPTGAGKSTILDAITLALYNQVPRLGKISKNDIEKMGSLVTHHTNEAYAEIKYECPSGVFTSVWKIAKNRNDNWNDYHMEIHDATTNELLDLKKSMVPEKNSELIGLNYDQFVKSIILSQGEFSQFLKANESDRSALLEKITGTEIYREIGKAAFSKQKVIQEKIQNEQAKMDAIQSLSDEEIVGLKERLKVYKIDTLALEQKLKEYQSIKASLENKMRHELKMNEAVKNRKLIEIKIQDFMKKELALDRHEALNDFRGDIVLHKNKTTELIQIEQSLLESNSNLKLAEENQKMAIASLAQLSGENVNSENFSRVMIELEKKVSFLESKLEEIKRNGIEIKNDIENERNRLSNAARKLVESVGDKEEESLLNYANQIRSNPSYLNYLSHSNEELSLIKVELNSKKEIVGKIIDLQKELDGLNSKLATLNLSNVSIQKSHKKLITDEESMRLSITEKSSRLEVKRKTKESYLSQMSLEEWRGQLKEGEPCPLCGSESHPMADHQVIDLGLLEIEIYRIAEELKNENAGLELIVKDISKIAQELAQNEIQSNDLSNEIMALKKEFESSLEKIDTKVDLKAQLIELQGQISIVDEIVTIKSDLIIIDQLLGKYKKKNALMNEYQEIKKARNEIFGGKEVITVTNKLQNQYSLAVHEITTIIAAKTEKLSNAIQLKKDLEKLSQSLNNALSKLGYATIDEASSFILRDEVVRGIKADKSILEAEHTANETIINESRIELMKIVEDMKEGFELDQVIELINSMTLNKDENNKSIGELSTQIDINEKNQNAKLAIEKSLTEVKQEYSKWALLNEYIGDATGKKFSSFAQELTMEQIVSQTNIRLQSLTDRYLLYKKEGVYDLNVVDQYQGNTLRDIKTLSGGETFLLSLAMAISLSDIAAQNVRIDSLFIDEGFGTLDEETLEVAMDTLDSLQSESQKTIGIISHVESLKERIHTQIRVKRRVGGLSEIEVVS